MMDHISVLCHILTLILIIPHQHRLVWTVDRGGEGEPGEEIVLHHLPHHHRLPHPQKRIIDVKTKTRTKSQKNPLNPQVSIIRGHVTAEGAALAMTLVVTPDRPRVTGGKELRAEEEAAHLATEVAGEASLQTGDETMILCELAGDTRTEERRGETESRVAEGVMTRVTVGEVVTRTILLMVPHHHPQMTLI